MERLELKEGAAVRLFEGLKAASPHCYRRPFPWLFWVPSAAGGGPPQYW